jgi:hypothetical protein
MLAPKARQEIVITTSWNGQFAIVDGEALPRPCGPVKK